jgi:holo-[acyl-carrier protein] synthase
MEIIGVGTEVVECVRIQQMIDRHGELFLTRVFTDHEIRFCQARKRTTQEFAARWAAKEAVLKCLGTQARRELSWTDVEIVTDAEDRIAVTLGGSARELAKRLGVAKIMVSISYSRSFAVAYVTAVSQ